MDRGRPKVGRRRPPNTWRSTLSHLVAFLALAASLASPSHSIARDAVAAAQTAGQDIVADRLRIYNQVIQTMVIETARGATPGNITVVPPLPFGDRTVTQVVVLDVATLEAQGFTFNEFFLPPGTVVPTTESQIILSYQSYPPANSPVQPPPGYQVVSSLVTLTVFPMSALTNAGAKALSLTAPVGAPITVTFRTVSSDALCTLFNQTTGSIQLVTTQTLPTQTVCDTTAIGTFTLTRAPAPPPGSAPTPAPAPAPGPTPTPPALAPNPAPVTNIPPGPALSPGPASPPPPPPSSSSNTGLIVGLCVGLGLPLLILIGLGIWYATRVCSRKALERMEKESDKRASLETAIVGGSRAPAAGALRTRPYLESEEMTTDRI